MAVVLVNLVATVSRTVWIKPPDEVRQWSAWPRALLNFNILNGVIAAKPVDDQEELTVSIVLQTNLAYKLVDFNASLIQDVAQDWEPNAYLEVTNGIRNLVAGATQRHRVQLHDMVRTPVPSEMWIAGHSSNGPTDLPRYVIQSTSAGNSPVIAFKATNQQAAVGAAGTMNFFCSFWEYDIEQAEGLPLHFGVQTYHR